MRRTQLKRAVIGVVLAILCVVVTVAVIRSMITPIGAPDHERAEISTGKGPGPAQHHKH